MLERSLWFLKHLKIWIWIWPEYISAEIERVKTFSFKAYFSKDKRSRDCPQNNYDPQKKAMDLYCHFYLSFKDPTLCTVRLIVIITIPGNYTRKLKNKARTIKSIAKHLPFLLRKVTKIMIKLACSFLHFWISLVNVSLIST